MKTYILLFRGINVGGHGRLPMQALVSLLEQQGCRDVRTYIQSGNVVLRNEGRPGTGIGEAIAAEFGFNPVIVVLERRDLDQAVAGNPYATGEGNRVHFYFTTGKLKPQRKKLEQYRAASEQYLVTDKVFYLHAPDGIARSKLVANIDACLGVPVTGRNLNTITRLQALAADS